jgi:hypothetical protein
MTEQERSEKIKAIKEAFAKEVNALFEKYNKEMEGETIFLIGLRDLDTGYYTIDAFKSLPGRTFKDLYVLWSRTRLCSYNERCLESKTEKQETNLPPSQ